MSGSRWLARVGMVSIVAFVVTVLILHAATLGRGPRHMSEFVHTPLAPLWIAALVAFALGGIALTLELRRRLQHHRFRHAGISMLWLAGAGAIVLAACPVDADPMHRTFLGQLHEDAAPPTFLMAAAAMIVLAPVFHREKSWRGFAGLSLVCGLMAFSLAVVYVLATLADAHYTGVIQRLMVGSIVTWLLLLAIRLVRPDPVARREAADPKSTCTV